MIVIEWEQPRQREREAVKYKYILNMSRYELMLLLEFSAIVCRVELLRP